MYCLASYTLTWCLFVMFRQHKANWTPNKNVTVSYIDIDDLPLFPICCRDYVNGAPGLIYVWCCCSLTTPLFSVSLMRIRSSGVSTTRISWPGRACLITALAASPITHAWYTVLSGVLSSYAAIWRPSEGWLARLSTRLERSERERSSKACKQTCTNTSGGIEQYEYRPWNCITTYQQICS